jgi:hypothetical protein
MFRVADNGAMGHMKTPDSGTRFLVVDPHAEERAEGARLEA